MTFKEVLAQVIEWLQQDKRLSYRALKRQFALDDEYLDDLKAELIEVRRVAVEEDGRVLVWTGDAAPAPVAEPPPQAIRMKLSVDSLDQSAGFVLFCQTLSEYLGRSVSFS